MIVEGIIKLVLAAGVYKIAVHGDMRFNTNRQVSSIGFVIVAVLVIWAIYDFLIVAGIL